MRIQLFAAAAVACAMAASAQAQPVEDKRPTILVRGVAEAKTPAEWIGLGWKIRGEGRTQVDALRAANTRHDRVKAALAGLPGLRRLTIEAGELSVRDVRGDQCRAPEYEAQLSMGACAIVGYTAEIEVEAVLAPAERVGDAASLAVELGVTDLDIKAGGIDQPQALGDQAAKAAMDDARRQAEVLAAASGGRLGPIIRIQDARQVPERIYLEGTTRVEDLLNAGPRGASNPAVPINLTPPPVTRRADFTVVYTLER